MALRFDQPACERGVRLTGRQRGDELFDRVRKIEHAQTKRGGDQEGVDFAGGLVDPSKHKSRPVAISRKQRPHYRFSPATVAVGALQASRQ
jgi:hypothetical protein